MDHLDVSRLVRNPDKIKGYFKDVGNSIVATGSIRVIFPERYINKDLAIIGSSVRVVSVYAILDDDNNYAVSNIPIYIELTPSNVSEVEIEGVVNKVCHFSKGDIYAPNNILVKEDKFLYDLFDEFIIQGNVPWFLKYDDVANILAQARMYTGRGIGDNPIAMEILASIITKSPADRKLYYRQALEKSTDVNKLTPKFIGLMNMHHTFDNTIAKLVGSYFATGVTTAILDKEEETTNIEEILRA